MIGGFAMDAGNAFRPMSRASRGKTPGRSGDEDDDREPAVTREAPAALLDPTRAHTRRSLKGRPCVRAGSRYPREVLHSETTPVASASAARSGVSIDPFATGHHARVPSSGRWGFQTSLRERICCLVLSPAARPQPPIR